MRHRKVPVVITGAMITAMLFLASVPANALIVTFQQAGNACFPRVFSQINFFKMSNGGLRNDSSTPKSIVCSFDVVKENTVVPTVNSAQAFISMEELDASMDCTVQVRDAETNIVIDSNTVALPAGTSGITSLGTMITTGSYDQKHLYVQCRVPAQGRVFSIVGA